MNTLLLQVAQDVLRRDIDVIEEQGAGRNAPRAHLVFLAADVEALHAAVDDEEVDGATVFLAGAGGDQEEIRYGGVGAPDLAAAEPVASTVPFRSRSDAAHVGTALRLGQRKPRAQGAVREAGQQPLLLLLGAACQDAADRRPLYQQQIGRIVRTAPAPDGHAGRQQRVGAAELRRKRQRGESELAQQVEHVLRVFGGAVDLGGTRRDAFRCDAAYQVLDRALVLAEGEVS